MAELNHVPHLGPDVVLEEVGDDVLAFDGETLTRLTGAAAAVSRAVDGIRSVADLNRALGTDVTEALDLLVEHGLVDLEGPSPGPHYRRPDHVGACIDGDRVVLLDLATGDRHVLEGGGSTIWDLVTSGHSLSSGHRPSSRAPIRAPESREEATRLVEQLVGLGLLGEMTTSR